MYYCKRVLFEKYIELIKIKSVNYFVYFKI